MLVLQRLLTRALLGRLLRGVLLHRVLLEHRLLTLLSRALGGCLGLLRRALCRLYVAFLLDAGLLLPLLALRIKLRQLLRVQKVFRLCLLQGLLLSMLLLLAQGVDLPLHLLLLSRLARGSLCQGAIGGDQLLLLALHERRELKGALLLNLLADDRLL